MTPYLYGNLVVLPAMNGEKIKPFSTFSQGKARRNESYITGSAKQEELRHSKVKFPITDKSY